MIKPATRINLARVLQHIEAEGRDNKENLNEMVKLFREQANRFEAMVRSAKESEPVKQPTACPEGLRFY